MSTPSESQLSEMRPRLIAGSRFIEFSPGIEFLKHPSARTYLKLKTEDGRLIRLFTGDRTLAQILHHQLESTGTTQFQRILSILLLLYQRGFLASAHATLQGLNFCIFQERNILSRLAQWILPALEFDVAKIRSRFDSSLLQFCARALSSSPGVMMLSLAALANNFFPAGVRGVDFGNAMRSLPVSGVAAFLVPLAVLWTAVCVMVSIKNLLTAYALAGRGCEVITPRVRFEFGLVYFDCDPADIITAGRTAVIQLHGLRILLPLALMTGLTLLAVLGLNAPVLGLIKEACILVAVFGILPLANTDMNRALGVLSNGTTNFAQNLAYLRTQYVAHFLSFKRRTIQGLEFSHLLVVSTLVWLLVAFSLFHTHLLSKYRYILENVDRGLSWTTILMITQLFIFVTPFLVLLGQTVSIVLSNAKVMFRLPARRLLHFAETISRQDVPAGQEVVSFLKEIPLFSQLDTKHLEGLCSYLKLVKFGSQHRIILQGERGDAFYIIVSGMVAIEIEDEYGQTQIVDTLTTGHSFGEIALVENVPRTATVRSVTPVSLFVLDRAHFLNFARHWAGGLEQLTDIIRTSRLLTGSALFSHVPPSQMRTLISRFETRVFEPGAVIFSQGDPAEGVFLIREGKIEIRRAQEGSAAFTKTLGTGDWLGEIALVKSIPRTATAAAVQRSVLLALKKDDFYDIMQHSLLTGVEFNKLAEQRLHELRKKTIGVS